MKLKDYQFWFVVGSQFLYGEETLKEVARDSAAMVKALNGGGHLPCEVVLKPTVLTNDGARDIVREANYDGACAGIIVFCHTFSPSKMWINALEALQKPYLHFHTQFNEAIPNDEIDMDYMNLHQSAHGDREHGFIAARMRMPRKVVVGHWQNAGAQASIGKWMRSAVGAAVSKTTKVMRFGDNMREVAVTEGDKVGVQMRLGWQVNTWAVGALTDAMDAVTDAQIDEKIAEYQSRYTFAANALQAARYQAREELAIKAMLDAEGCIAFTNTFEDLYGMEQLPGLATQNLMACGYGYGGEGDWKVSAMTAIMKAMSEGLTGGTTFMEDYTYDYTAGLILGAHMLEVCPSIARDKPRVEVHELGIGGKNPPARLVFEGRAGPVIAVSLIDMGGRLRMIAQEAECVKPTLTMPKLPVARTMWRPAPSLADGAHCWILAGGAHHTVLSHDCDAEMMRDWARIMGIEFVHITKETTPAAFERELELSDMVWRMKM